MSLHVIPRPLAGMMRPRHALALSPLRSSVAGRAATLHRLCNHVLSRHDLGRALFSSTLWRRALILSPDLAMRRRSRLSAVCDFISTSACACYSTSTSIGFACSLIDLLSGTETLRIPCFSDAEIAVLSSMSAGRGRLR